MRRSLFFIFLTINLIPIVGLKRQSKLVANKIRIDRKAKTIRATEECFAQKDLGKYHCNAGKSEIRMNAAGDPERIFHYSVNGELTDSCCYYYDVKERLIEYGFWDIRDSSLNLKWVDTYDTCGNKISEEEFDAGGAKLFITKYDRFRHPFMEYCDFSGSPPITIVWKFDNDQKLLETDFMDERGKLTSAKVYSYSRNGRVVVWKEISSGGKVYRKRITSYNSKGDEVSSYQSDTDGKFRFVEITKYNRQRDVISSTNKVWQGKRLRKEDLRYNYQYDANGNFVKEKLYFNGNMVQVITRTIEY